MKNLSRLIREYALKYRKEVFLVLLLVAIVAALELVSPRLIQYIVDEGIEAGNMQAVWIGAGLMIGAAILSAAATVRRAIEAAKLSQGMAFDLRNSLFTKIQGFSFKNLDTHQTGQLMTRVSSDVDIVRMFTGMGTPMLLRVFVLLIGSLIMIFITEARLASIVLGFMALLIFLFVFIARKAAPLFTIVQEKLGDLNTFIQENFTGIDVVKAFVQEKRQINAFDERNEDYLNTALKAQRILIIAFPLIITIANLASLTILVIGGREVIEGIMSVGELIAFNSYLMTVIFPLMMLGMIITMLSQAEASAERLTEIFDSENSIFEKDSAVDLKEMKGKVEFRNVSFSYSNECCDDRVLNDVSFTVNPGETIAIMGATGSGKSSLITLIPRFYDPQEGAVLIDGQDIRDLTLSSLRENIGIVLQSTTLFTGTIAENIAYGKPDASQDEIIAVAKAAQAHEFITEKPEGYESMVEARGANLSGGQKQRLAIARAMLIEPAILILDDSTSSVDMETEFLIQEALETIMENRTSFIIAQRLSSVLSADKIIIMDKGQINGIGTHAELMKTNQIYQEIYRSQLEENSQGAKTSDLASTAAD